MRKLVLPVLICFVFLVSPTATARETAGDHQLKTILANTAEYCRQLKKAVFHFLCFETVTESVKKTLESGDIARKEGFYKGYTKLNVYRPKKVKNKYVNEYQIIKEGDKIRERRILIKHNGKKNVRKKSRPENKTLCL